MKKIILSGIVATVAIFLIGMVVELLIFYFWGEVSVDAGVVRPMQDPIASLYYVYPLILGFMMAIAWNKIKIAYVGKSTLRRGLCFGLGFWLVALFPYMFITYVTFQISLALIMRWFVIGLMQLLGAGIVLSKLNQPTVLKQ
jgi:hypothetical protein